ncbi:MAG: tyrosine-type recombinase/integrase [Alkalispirochaeta sp.]
MARPARPYALYRRYRTKTKYSYYARLRDPETGKLTKTVATGKTSKREADEWVKRYLAGQTVDVDTSGAPVTVRELAAGFWDPSGHYAESRRVRGYPVSRGHLDISEGYTRNHIIPAWGPVPVADITTGAIDRWIIDLHQRGTVAPATVNKILQCFRSLLDGAVSAGHIADNPARAVKPVRVVHRERGVLTDDEVRELLQWPGPWTDYRHYAINTLAFATGARIGEIRALHVKDVHPDRVDILYSWEQGYGIKAPKYGSVRSVPISKHVYSVLEKVVTDYYPTSLLFYGAKSHDRPVSKSWIEKGLHRALVRMMTPEIPDDTPDEKRAEIVQTVESNIKERNIGVHSWRHKLNTVLRAAGVPDSKIRLLTGHRGQSMTDHYTRYAAADFTDVRNIQTALLEAVS